MSTFKRGRINKLETNLTSSFIAGGTQYTHHADSLIASYRFEEPFVVDLDNAESLTVKDITGDASLDAVITAGSIVSGDPLDPEEIFLAGRTVASSPHLFNKSRMKASGLTDTEKLTTPNDISGYQIRSLEFADGVSERVDLPTALVDGLKAISVDAITRSRNLYDSGATFAFWIRLTGDDALHAAVLPDDSIVKNPHVARSIFAVDRENYFDAYDPMNPLLGDEIDFGKVFGIRVYNEPNSERDKKISVFATFVNAGEKKQYEWISRKSIRVGTWTHVAIVFPFTYVGSSFGSGGETESFNIVPKIFFDGQEDLFTLAPADVKNYAEIKILEGIDYITSAVDVNKFVDMYIDVPTGLEKKTSLLRLKRYYPASSVPTVLPPSATLKLSAGFSSADNHMSKFNIRNSQGVDTGFLIDLYHTGSIAKRLNGNDEIESPQMVDPDPANLPTIDIRYDPSTSTFESAIKPLDGSFIRLSTANGTTRTYVFKEPGAVIGTPDYFTGPDAFGYTTFAAQASDGVYPWQLVGPDNVRFSIDDGDNTFFFELNETIDIDDAAFLDRTISVGTREVDDQFKMAQSLFYAFRKAILPGAAFSYKVTTEPTNGSTSPPVAPRDLVGKVTFIVVPPAGSTITFTKKNGVNLTLTFVAGTAGPNEISIDTPSPLANAAAAAAALNTKINALPALSGFFSSSLSGVEVTITGDNTPPDDTLPQINISTENVVGMNCAVCDLDADNSGFEEGFAGLLSVLNSGIVPLTLRNAFATGSINFIEGEGFFDVAFGGRFGMSSKPCNNQAMFNTQSLSFGFEVSNNIFIDNLINPSQSRDYSGFPFFSKSKNKISYICLNDGMLNPDSYDLVDSLPVGQPIFVFGDGSSLANTAGAEDCAGIVEGTDYASNRFIRTTQKFKGDSVVRFSAIPARVGSDYTKTISRKLANQPSTGLQVQVSLDGYTWHSAGYALKEVRRDGNLIDLRHEVTNATYVRSAVKLSDGVGAKISFDDFDASNTWWRQFAFYCDAANILNPHIQDYYIRIIQEGYSTSYSDNWAITNLSVEGTISHDINDSSPLAIDIEDITEDTWQNFVDVVNGSLGHAGEISATHNAADRSVKLTFQSPPGITQEGKPGSLDLIRSPRTRDESLEADRGIVFCLTKQERIKLTNFEVEGSSSQNSHIRIGLRDIAADPSDALDRIVDVINSASLTYTPGKSLTAERQGDRLCIYDNRPEESLKPAILTPVARQDGVNAAGWTLVGFEDLRFARSINVYDLNSAAAVANKICEVISDYSGSFGVRPWRPLPSVSASFFLEHLENNTSGGDCSVRVYSGESGEPGTEPTAPAPPIVSAPIEFSHGVYRKTHPAGSLFISDAHEAFLGTSFNDLEYYLTSPYPVRGFSSEILPIASASLLAGRTPRCLIDDFSVWSRCLLSTEINAIFASHRGAFDPISGISSLDPRIQIRELDNLPGEYPTNVRSSDEDFRGDLPVKFDSNLEVSAHRVFATAEMTFHKTPLVKSFVRLTDWRYPSNSATFVFWPIFLPFPALADLNLPAPVDIVGDQIIRVTIDFSSIEKTVFDFVEKINSLGPNGGSQFGITARSLDGKRVIFSQTGVDALTGSPQGNTEINYSAFFQDSRNASTSSAFTGAFLDSTVEFPSRLSSDSAAIQRLMTPTHARSTMALNAPSNTNPLFNVAAVQEPISPYKEDSQFAAFGIGVHADADAAYFDNNDAKPKGGFWSSNVLKSVGSQSTDAKHKIEIDINPVDKTKLFKHTTIGSTTAYYNFERAVWEPIGTIHEGTHLPSAAGTSDVCANLQIAVSKYPIAGLGTTWAAAVGEIRQTLFSLTDSYGRTVRFIGVTENDLVGPNDTFRRFSSTEIGVIAPEASSTANKQFAENIYAAINGAFLIGDLNIKPVSVITSTCYGIKLYQADAGEEGNTEIYLNSNLLIRATPPVSLDKILNFFDVSYNATFFDGTGSLSTTKDRFASGNRLQIDTASQHGMQHLFEISGSTTSRDKNFSRWLDSLTIGFGPSIGLHVAKSTDVDYELVSGGQESEGKYIFLDGGIANPTTAFGFPFHPKFHATGSQTFEVSSVIKHPFVVEKIVYEFRANVFESASIEAPGDSFGSPSYLTSRVNLPAPTFFILNQRKCALPNLIENNIDSLKIKDESLTVTSFNYTASIPTDFYLTSMSSGPGELTHVDSLRDLVTFARFSAVPAEFNNDIFESFVSDARSEIDLVIVPNDSDESTNEGQLLQEAHPAASFVIAAPVRAPRKSDAYSSFKVEGDFLGSKPTTYTFEFVTESDPFSTAAKYSDAFILEDSAGVIRRFVFSHVKSAYADLIASTHLVNLDDLVNGGNINIKDFRGGGGINFKFNPEVLPDEPAFDPFTDRYSVGVRGLDVLTGSDYRNAIVQAVANAVNLANSDGALHVFASVVLDAATPPLNATVRLTQVFGGIPTDPVSITGITPGTIEVEFDGGGSVEEDAIVYRDFGVSRDLRFESVWVIPVTQSLSSPDGQKYYASRFYEALSIAGSERQENGGFAIPFVLQATGSTATETFTFSQGVGGRLGHKDIAGLQDSDEDYKDLFIKNYPALNYADYARIYIAPGDIGEIQGDVLQLGWAGNRTGINTLQTGRSPLGGENATAETNYISIDGAGVCPIKHSLADCIDSPYLLLPGDRLIFGWQAPIASGSHLVHGALTSERGSFEILPGAGKIVLYGSFLQNGEEKTHVTSNQPLTSNAVHESIFSDADVHDAFDTEPAPFHYDNSLDQFVDGIVSVTASPPILDRRIISKASAGNHAVGPRDGSYPIFSKRSSFFRGARLVDEKEFIYDAMLPTLGDLMARDNAKTFSPGYDVNNSNCGVVLLSHPNLSASIDSDNNDNIWSTWMASFPFESKYEGVTRTLSLSTGIRTAGSGTTELGVKRLTNVWLVNNSNSLQGYRPTDLDPNDVPPSEDYCNMFFNIEARNLFLDSESAVIGGKIQPYNINYTILTDESGEGSPGEEIDFVDFAQKVLGTRIGPRTSYFFSRLLFGAGTGPYKFPKLPYWKSISANPDQGFDANETFMVSRGVVIRGFKYGLANVVPTRTSAVFRRDRFGQFRDMLEQRLFTVSFVDNGVSATCPVTVEFRDRNTSAIADAIETNSLNLSMFCTSSIPYDDGNYRDRPNLGPDDRSAVNVSLQIT